MAHSSNNGKDNNKDTKEKKVSNTSRVIRRGRPLGSKNKPKKPIHVTETIHNVVKTNVIQFASGVNIAESLLDFSKSHQVGLCILSAHGSVCNVTIRNASGAIMLLNGRFDMVSLNGSFLPIGPIPSSWLTVFLGGADSKGRVIGGTVVGPLISSGPVTVIAATFESAIYERLPLLSDVENADEDFTVMPGF